MKVSLNWIKEFVDIDVPSQEIADRLSMAGLAVDSIQHVGGSWEGVFTATLLKVEKHPNADRLTLCEVQCGPEVVQVVCGARNHKTGDKVALARPGTKLPNGMEIQISEIRKVKSFGMLCSEKELGLAEEGEGILILPPETSDGLPLKEVLPGQDTILELDITANRGDCLSMQGVARETAAIHRLPFQLKFPQVPAKNPPASAKVELGAPQACRRYACRVIHGVKIKPSPIWVQRRLANLGIRPINNVVDATNYAMLESGQPLHAFDLRQIHGGQIVVRFAKEGETFKTLDSVDRKLIATDLVIADHERILALAGVMGGEDSGIKDDTVDLLLESAWFSPVSVRKTSKRLGLQTDSSYRFERGVDPDGCARVLERLTQLISDWAGAEGIGEIVDTYPTPWPKNLVELRSNRMERIIGITIPHHDVESSLTALGMGHRLNKAGNWEVEVPNFRSDISREIDLIEEVARIYGYNLIPYHYPQLSVGDMPLADQDPLLPFDRIRTRLAGWGFTEILNYSFTSPELLKRFEFSYPPEQVLANPLSEELSVMRPSLIPQLVETIRGNLNRGAKRLSLFELRPVYRFDRDATPPYEEQWRLALGLCGERKPLHFMEKAEDVSFLDLKGYLEALVARNGRFELVFPKTPKAFLHPKRQAEVLWFPDANSQIPRSAGYAGEIHPQLLTEWDLAAGISVAEIIFDFFLTEAKNSIQFKKISPYPGIDRDLNLLVDEAVSQGEVIELIRQAGGALLRKVEFFDLYRDPPIPEGKKALTYRIEYGADERTLTDEEVNRAREELLTVLKNKVGAYLR